MSGCLFGPFSMKNLKMGGLSDIFCLYWWKGSIFWDYIDVQKAISIVLTFL